MEYLEFLEHVKTLLAAQKRSVREIGCDNLGQSLYVEAHISEVIESEIQAERQRGELALKLSEPIPPEDIMGKPGDPFRCAQCGDAIYYGERQHVCRGGK